MNDAVKLTGQVKWEKYKNGILVEQSPWTDNVVMANSGRGTYLLLDRLTNITTYTGVITHADIGTSSTAPTSADTDLVAGVLRAQVGYASRTSNYASFRFFYPDSLLPNGTYREFGTFTDGTATLGSGQLFNRVLFGAPLVKATGEDNAILARITATV